MCGRTKPNKRLAGFFDGLSLGVDVVKDGPPRLQQCVFRGCVIRFRLLFESRIALVVGHPVPAFGLGVECATVGWLGVDAGTLHVRVCLAGRVGLERRGLCLQTEEGRT